MYRRTVRAETRVPELDEELGRDSFLAPGPMCSRHVAISCCKFTEIRGRPGRGFQRHPNRKRFAPANERLRLDDISKWCRHSTKHHTVTRAMSVVIGRRDFTHHRSRIRKTSRKVAGHSIRALRVADIVPASAAATT
jgi:hypothetical protein